MFSLIELSVYVFHVSMCPMLNIQESKPGWKTVPEGQVCCSMVQPPCGETRMTNILIFSYFVHLNEQTNKQVYMSKYSFLKLSRQMPPLRVESSGCWLTPLLDIFTLCNISTRCKPQPPPQQTPPQSEILT